MPYAAVLAVLALGLAYARKPKPGRPGNYRPTVTVFIPTLNEEKYIVRKLDNVLAQTYPLHEILVLDCSSDRTPEIVRKYQESNPCIKLVKQSQRLGMAKTLNEALNVATGEIFVYTNCDSFTEDTNALERLVAHFSNPEIGGVTGVCANSGLEGQFRKFMNWVQRAESALDSTIIAHGPSLMAFRKQLAEPVREDSLADDTEEFVRIRRKGFKTVADTTIISREVLPQSFATRRLQKDRRAQGIIRVLFQNLDVVFNPKYDRYGMIVFPMDLYLLVISPFVLLMNLVLVGYLMFALGWTYLAAFLTVIVISLFSTKILAFIDLQLGGLVGTVRALTGSGSGLWPKDRIRPR